MIIEKDEQGKRIDIVAHVEKSIFVEAGAGAGKTTLIVQRITNQIRQGFLKPEELVVITFTNKAAGELFERIQKAFEAEEKNPDNSKEEQARFTYAIEHLEQMHISTIHSFCYSILKERCFDAKLPIDVELLENAKVLERQETFFEKWFADQSKVAIEEIKKSLIPILGNDYFYRDKVEHIFLKICEKPQDVNFVSCSDAELMQLEKDVKSYALLAENLLKQLNDEIILMGNKGKEIFEKHTGVDFYPGVEGLKLKSFYKYWGDIFPRAGGASDTYNKWVAVLYGPEEVALCNKGKKDMEKIYAAINDEFNGWLNAVIRPNNLYKKWSDAEQKRKELANSFAYYTLLKYAIKARDAYLSQLDHAHLSNEQLIQKAKELIWSSEKACTYFGNKYKCIYVDEFQDTDHIQADLVWKLACDKDGQLKPGALFVVGDPKQAIYRFRGGEPAVYNQIKEKMIADAFAEVYELDNNYRSNDEIIDWVNAQFKDPIDASGIHYRDMACVAKMSPELSPKDGEEELVIKGVYHMPTLAGYEKDAHGDKANYEALMLTLLIQRMVKAKYQIYENRKTASGYERVLRPVQYGDFLILCKDTKAMDYYIEAMKEESIPVDLAGKTDIEQSSVLKSFLVLYRFLVLPYDRKARQGARHIVFHQGIQSMDAQVEERLDVLYEKTKSMNLYGKAEYLLLHMEYLLPWDEVISKEEIYALQARLHQMVESVFALAKEEPEYIVKSFEEYISNLLERELMLDENQNAVRFMNVHKAKGLEGNITIITNRKAKNARKRFVPDYTSSEANDNGEYDYYTSCSDNFSMIHGYEYNADAKAALEKAEEQEAAELIRLEYVAATRAKEVLIVTESYGSGAFLSDYTVPVEKNIANIFLREMEEEKNEADVILTAGETSFAIPTEEMKQMMSISLSPSHLEGSLQNDEESHILTAEERNKFPRRPKGNVFGTTMHRSFELLLKQEGDVSTCVCQAIIENADDLLVEGRRRYLEKGEPAELYLTAVRNFLEPALIRFQDDATMCVLLENAKSIYTELSFSYYTSPKEHPQMFAAIGEHLEKHKYQISSEQLVWVNGTADLVVEDKDGKIHIIDFKSDTKYVDSMDAFEASLYEKYEGQLLLYKYSMSRIFGVDLSQISAELYHLYR